MLIAALALAGQTVTLDPDPYKAAVDCAFAVGGTMRAGEPRDQAAAEVSYFLMQGALAMPGNGSLFEKLGQVQRDNASHPSPSQAQARQLMPLCEARYPKARSEKPVTLPSDPFERDVICHYLLALMSGAAESGDPQILDRYESAMRVYRVRVQKGRASHGFAAEGDMLPWASAALTRTLDQGNAYIYSQACIAALPA